MKLTVFSVCDIYVVGYPDNSVRIDIRRRGSGRRLDVTIFRLLAADSDSATSHGKITGDYTVVLEYSNRRWTRTGDVSRHEQNTDWTAIQYTVARLWMAAARRGDDGNAGSDCKHIRV
ncbi:unnamed protein product [Macrosiphum euphorbiae]|uniref:Uncharacterized protein n=1 Tax=Macrosiphum euphorbiae TaxID=13131 RepID=A0AAV0XNT6_9HEMI|nr:unnamed protein product [Macrosiphum euphorbiae]